MHTVGVEFDLPKFEIIAKEVAGGAQKDSSKIASQIGRIYKPVLTFDSAITSDSAVITLHVEVAGDRIRADLDVWNLLTARSYKQTQTIVQPSSEPAFMGTISKLIAYIIALILLSGACYMVFFRTK